jgi:hypothetical protein
MGADGGVILGMGIFLWFAAMTAGKLQQPGACL